MKRLETDRIIIRRIEASDAEQAHALFTDGEAMRWVGMYPPLENFTQTEERIAEWVMDDEEERFAIIDKATGDFIGYVAVNPDSEEGRADTKEFGFATVAAHRRKGYMKEALTAVLKELKEEGVSYVWACCFKGNEASEMLIKSFDFELQQEGTYQPANDVEYVSLEYMISL